MLCFSIIIIFTELYYYLYQKIETNNLPLSDTILQRQGYSAFSKYLNFERQPKICKNLLQAVDVRRARVRIAKQGEVASFPSRPSR